MDIDYPYISDHPSYCIVNLGALAQHFINVDTVMVQVDNIGCHFAWENGYARSDTTASILVRTLVLLSEFLNCTVIVNHHPRESSWEIKLADRLSRESSTTSQDRKLVQSFQRRNLPSVFSVWMENPSEDWDLPKKIMSVMSR